MNKEVIYLEPEDDITDILTKLQQAEQKLVALVPPKKATMLRSAVNMKLVARTAKECDKVAVIVTADPAIVKMAMVAQVPIAKTLQSRPVVPTKADLADTMAEEQIIDEDLADASAAAELEGSKSQSKTAKKPAEDPHGSPEKTSPKTGDIIDLNEETLENDLNGPKNRKKTDKKPKNDQKVPSFEKYRKWIIIGAISAVLLVVVGVWAFVFAPAVKITVAMNTSSENVSEEIKFTTNKDDQNLAESLLYAEKQTLEQHYEGEFTATGEEDRGERAKGNIVASYTFTPSAYVKKGISIDIPSGAEFVASTGKVYRATAGGSITWDGDNADALKTLCASKSSSLSTSCKASVTIPVEAAGTGEDFNLEKDQSWNDYQGASITNEAITGGTTNKVTIVGVQDINSARDELVDQHKAEDKDKLMKQLDSDEIIIIEPSYSEEVTETTTKPEAGAEVGESKKATISVKVSYSVYTLRKNQLEEFLTQKLSLGDDQRIYSIGEPYFDRYTSIEEAARLKTTVKTGPTVTEETIIERSKGKKIGEVQSLLRSINGVSSVNISPSYFWVGTVPNDSERITVDLTVEDR